MDTINHVLDFTNINFSEQSSNQAYAKHNGADNFKYSMTNIIKALCEEVVDGMIVSDVHHDVSEPTKRRDPTRLSDPKSPGSDYAPIVSVSLDFEA